jgi:hypothetical protein
MSRKKATCNARTRAGTPCRCKPVRPGGRCRLHGGLSTGPTSASGKEQARRNLEAARAFLASDDPAAIEARRRRAEKAAETRARNRTLRREAEERERRRAAQDAEWREWCARYRIDPVAMRRIPRTP